MVMICGWNLSAWYLARQRSFSRGGRRDASSAVKKLYDLVTCGRGWNLGQVYPFLAQRKPNLTHAVGGERVFVTLHYAAAPFRKVLIQKQDF
jgi:hypothetical protein